MIVKVPPKDLHIIWNEVEPEIKALDDCYTAQDILDGLIQKDFNCLSVGKIKWKVQSLQKLHSIHEKEYYDIFLQEVRI